MKQVEEKHGRFQFVVEIAHKEVVLILISLYWMNRASSMPLSLSSSSLFLFAKVFARCNYPAIFVYYRIKRIKYNIN